MIEIFSFVSSCCHFNSNSTSAACRSRPIQFNSIHTHEVYVWEPVFQVWVLPNPGGCERPEGKVGGWNTPNGIILASCFFQTEKYMARYREREEWRLFFFAPFIYLHTVSRFGLGLRGADRCCFLKPQCSPPSLTPR